MLLTIIVPTEKPLDGRLLPPERLTARQKELWEEIVAAKPAGWFTADAKALLVGYVSAIASHERLSKHVDRMEAGEECRTLKDEAKLYAMVERQARLIQTFATKMRLTQQARYSVRSAATAHGRVDGPRPWD